MHIFNIDALVWLILFELIGLGLSLGLDLLFQISDTFLDPLLLFSQTINLTRLKHLTNLLLDPTPLPRRHPATLKAATPLRHASI